MLPLTFAEPADYDKIKPDDKVRFAPAPCALCTDFKLANANYQQVDILCTELAVGKPITMVVHPKDGQDYTVQLQHTFNEPQIEWFKNGSALNTMAKSAKQ